MDVKAIIIGIGSYNDLGLIRSCGEAGINSIYLNHGSKLVVPINKSKYVVEFRYIPVNKIVDSVNEIAEKTPTCKFLVFPASDIAVEAMDENLKKLKQNVVTSHAHGNIKNLIDKDSMGLLAQKAGLFVPKTFVIDFNDNICYDNYEYPLILKPISSVKGSKSDIVICENFKELENACKILVNKGYKSILAQQYLNNETSKEIGITGVAFPDGTSLIKGYIHKIRNRANINNYGIYYPYLSEDIIKSLHNYILSTGYQGIFDTDFIDYDGKLYFIECNFRNGAYGYGVTGAGLNMPFIWAAKVFNFKRTEYNLRKNTFMEERTDMLNVFDRTIPLFKWLKDFFTCDTFLWWNKKDMRPFIFHWLNKALKIKNKMLKIKLLYTCVWGGVKPDRLFAYGSIYELKYSRA